MPNKLIEDRSVFFHEFNHVVTVTPAGKKAGGASGYTLNCIFDSAERDIGGVMIDIPVITYDSEALITPAINDLITDESGNDYKVIDIMDDGTGMSDGELELKR